VDPEYFEPNEKDVRKGRTIRLRNDDEMSSDELREDDAGELYEAEESDEFTSPRALMQAYRDAKMLAEEKSREAEMYRRIFEQSKLEKQQMTKKANDETFTGEMRTMFQADPLAATAIMIQRANDDLLEAVDDRIMNGLREDREFKRLLGDFLSNPAHSKLKPYEDELKFLIRDKGLHADEAAELLKKIADKGSKSSNRLSAVAKEIRNRSMVESDGEIGEPLDGEKEFERTMKKAKSLDEMFASLSKFRI
jgi:hypothetical protein